MKETSDGQTVTINSKGNNPIGGAKVVVTSNAKGEVSISVPSGNIIIQSNMGNIEASTKLGDVKVEGMNVKVKATVQAVIEAAIATINAKASAEVKAPIINLSAEGVMNLKAPIMKLEGGTTMIGNQLSGVAVSGPELLLYLLTHIHGISPGSGLSPAVVPSLPPMSVPSPTLLRSNIIL